MVIPRYLTNPYMLPVCVQNFSSRKVGRYDPKRGFTIEIRSITDGGEYYCLPQEPFPEHDDESWTVLVSFIGNGFIDSEFLHPKVCDL